MTRLRAGICATLVLLGACGAADSVNSGPVETTPPSHQMHLEWTGSVTGTFDLVATAPSAPLIYSRPFVYSTAGTADGRPARMLIANRPGSAYLDGGTDIVYVILDQSITGPGKFGPGSCAQVAELPDCFRVQVILGTSTAGGNVKWVIRSLTGQGRLTITHWSADRVVASFEGRYEYTPGISSGAPGDTLTITNGFVDAINLPGEHWPP
jgi:hypothetical protein